MSFRKEKLTELALLKEWWSLLRAGHSCEQIKFSNNRIYINDQLHGEVINLVLKYSFLSSASTSSVQSTVTSHPQQPQHQDHQLP